MDRRGLRLPLAEELHDKVLFADADMQKAHWMTAAGTILGILGSGSASGGPTRVPLS